MLGCSVNSKPPPNERSTDERRALFDAVHAVLRRPSAVPVQYEPGELNPSLNNVQILRQLAFALTTEGDLHRVAGNTTGAQRSYLDLVELGTVSSRGGLVVDWLVGVAFEGMGIEGLRKLRGALTADQRQSLISALWAYEARREPAVEVFARDVAWEHRAAGWPARIAFINPWSMTHRRC
jgi:hypothetical protein